MKIMKKITWYHNRIKDGDGALANKIRQESIKALFAGKGKDDWKAFMRNFHSNPKQLQRLFGDDGTFMADSWGPVILAYLVGSGPCGGGTNFSMVMDMHPIMKAFLDEGIDPRTDQTLVGEDEPVKIPENLRRYLDDEPLTDEVTGKSVSTDYEQEQSLESASSEIGENDGKAVSVTKEQEQSPENEIS